MSGYVNSSKYIWSSLWQVLFATAMLKYSIVSDGGAFGIYIGPMHSYQALSYVY